MSASPQNSAATVTINGSSNGTVSLVEGANNITIVVTAEDGTTSKTSTLVITRAGFETALANANLQSLSLSPGTLNEPFDSNTASYTTNVAYEVTSLKVTALTHNSQASLTVNGVKVTSGSPSSAITLAEGSNNVAIVVTAEDGKTTKPYTLIITRAGFETALANANLQSLGLSPGSLNEPFDSSTTRYSANVSYETSSIQVSASPHNSAATVTINGSSNGTVSLVEGVNNVAIVVTAEDGITQKTYTLVVSRAYSITATAGSNGTISPGSASVNHGSTTRFTVTPATGYSINTVTGCSGSLTGNTYTTGAITRACTVSASFKVSANNANLQSLKLSTGSLTFNPQTTSYSVNFAYTVSSVQIIANPLNSSATLTVNGVSTGNNKASASISLLEGSNTITISVNSADRTTTKNYILNITRLAPTTTIANLRNLSLSTGGLSPAFQSLQPYYSATVGWPVGSLQVNASTEFPGASLTINGVAAASGVLSLDIELSEGENLIEIIVTASDNLTQRRYTITLTRQTLQSFAPPLNDTGIIWGGNYPTGNNASCIGETIDEQDCKHGRDAQAVAGSLSKVGAGHAGFDFTKLDASGNTLAATASSWSCVKDNVTGLIWEVKTTAGSGGIHDASNTYRWGGKTARLTGTFGTQYNDWDTLVDGSNNETLCGFSDWRVPSIKELEGLVNFNQGNPAIDSDYFPNTVSSAFWSSSPGALYAVYAWGVHFGVGYSGNNFRTDALQVRLVRGGQ